MSILDGFRDKDFLEQVTILNQLSCSQELENLPALVDLLEHPIGDISLDALTANALNAIYTAHPEEAVKGLEATNPALRTLSIRACGETQPPAALRILMDRYNKVASPDERYYILSALSRFNAPESLPVFHQGLTDDDPLVAALCIETCGHMRDDSAVALLLHILHQSQSDEEYEECSLQTWKTINALAAIGTDEALQGLAKLLHHKNPTARRIITDAMVEQGTRVVPFLVRAFEKGDTDQRILVANLLGFIGSKTGADALVDVMDRGLADAENVRYALYESLGCIGTIKGIICLMDGLDEKNELTLMAVIGGLERHVNPGLIRQLATLILKQDKQSNRLTRAIIDSRATRLFSALYQDAEVGNLLMEALIASKDAKILNTFDAALSNMTQEQDRAKADLERLPSIKTTARTALVADDSKSMLAIQRAILTDLGFAPTPVSDGAQALAKAAKETFDLVVTDMNMPVMDGMELIQELRAMEQYKTIPIVMVTTESEATQRDLARQSGVSAFITKPFTAKALKSVITELTEQ